MKLVVAGSVRLTAFGALTEWFLEQCPLASTQFRLLLAWFALFTMWPAHRPWMAILAGMRGETYERPPI
jgi:hypothetical protein